MVIEVSPEPSFWDKIPGFPYESVIIGLDRGLRSPDVIKKKNDFARDWRSLGVVIVPHCGWIGVCTVFTGGC